MYNPAQFGKESFDKLNKMIKEIIDDYYANHDAEQFSRLLVSLKPARLMNGLLRRFLSLLRCRTSS